MILRAVPALTLAAVLACALVCTSAAARQASAAAPVSAPAATGPVVAPVMPGARAQSPRALPQALPQPAQPMAAASAGSLLQTVFGLAVVLAALALFAWVMKRYGPRQAAGAAGLRIVSALNLGGRERIIVVEVGDQWIVVGASPGRVNALATMPKQLAEAGPATLHPHEPAASSFGEWLKQTIEKRNAK